MPSPVARITQPVQVHAKSQQVIHRLSLLRMATQKPNGLEIEALAGSGQGMQMIGMCAAQADHASGSTGFCGA